jgi:hypothetical protein
MVDWVISLRMASLKTCVDTIDFPSRGEWDWYEVYLNAMVGVLTERPEE